jgi:TRAP-type C4-dicarboxylate transport system permease small subunit
VISLALAAFMMIFAWQTLNEAMRMTTAGEIHQAATMILPKWPSRWLLPIGGFLMALTALMMGIRKLIGEPPPTGPAEFKIAAHD